MMEYIPYYGAPTVHQGPLSVIRLDNRKILIEQNIKRETGPALYYIYISSLYITQLLSSRGEGGGVGENMLTMPYTNNITYFWSENER
jgi:hypothetical protein